MAPPQPKVSEAEAEAAAAEGDNEDGAPRKKRGPKPLER